MWAGWPAPVCRGPEGSVFMSGRYSFYHVPAPLQPQLPQLPAGFVARWNIAPRQPVWMLRKADGARQWQQALWGFTPRWSKNLSHVVEHARSETVGGQEFFSRSEERRVGKECRSRWSAGQ